MWCRSFFRTTARPNVWRRRCVKYWPTLRSAASRLKPSPGWILSCPRAACRRACAQPTSCWRRYGRVGARAKARCSTSEGVTRRGVFQRQREPPTPSLLALLHRHVFTAGDAGIELARPADLLLRILDHLAPLTDPADGAGDREQHGEHRGRETHRLQCDARIEVDIRVQLAVDEILVAESDLFELQRNLQHRVIAMAGLLEHRMTHLLHD